jgi:hypothetical protein
MTTDTVKILELPGFGARARDCLGRFGRKVRCKFCGGHSFQDTDNRTDNTVRQECACGATQERHTGPETAMFLRPSFKTPWRRWLVRILGGIGALNLMWFLVKAVIDALP